ncbi:epoxyqueuosine reductase QueH [Dendrosporobacter sp. 1207_IL3150]|uniref:epoxyqueuosine reductase QueH n=1 Tax=Dendrosporobacter sp. 1207_IL3150 TaxID=3084054 RepID=UPI002FDA158E
MRLLLHICCGPCAAFPLKHLRDSGYEITGYFYNPNIHPYKEFTRRLETAKEFALKMNLEMIVDDRYTLEEFLNHALSASGAGGRCGMCYESRLRQTARIAKANKFDCFSTSLLVSPYQKHELIKDACEKISKEEDIAFLYVDFRSGWTEGVTISKELELYRQPYCGCIFSERDRYHKIRKESM